MSSGDGKSGTPASGGGAAAASAAASALDAAFEDDPAFAMAWESMQEKTADEIRARTADLRRNIDISRREMRTAELGVRRRQAELRELKETLKLNVKLPYLVANIQEILDKEDDEPEGEDDGDDEAAITRDKSAVVKTSTRQTMFLPIIGLVPASELKPGDLVGVNKDSYIVLEKLPDEHDSRVKAMELDEKPTEDYTDIGGLDKQITELIEAVVLPMTQGDRFKKLGVTPPKGVLMHGPPGTGKTLLARACAKNTDAVFLKLAGPQLVQQYIGDGAKMVRDAFALAKEKAKERGGAIIFIDEIDAVGTKRHGSDQTGDREVQRTMLELLNQLDGFDSATTIKVIAATNRPDILDPALLRSGRLDRKIELPHPNEKARAEIMRIHSRKMRYDKDSVNFEELARSTEDFNGATMKAICVEAGMIALRRGSDIIQHEDYVDGIAAVQMKKRKTLQYYA